MMRPNMRRDCRSRTMLLGVIALAVLIPGCLREAPLVSRIESHVAAGHRSLDLAALTPFAWDRMYVFGPYTDHSRVERTLGFKWPEYAQTTIASSDSVCLLLFVAEGRIVHWCEQPRSVDFVKLAGPHGYSPSDARFMVDSDGGHILLQSHNGADR